MRDTVLNVKKTIRPSMMPSRVRGHDDNENIYMGISGRSSSVNHYNISEGNIMARNICIKCGVSFHPRTHGECPKCKRSDTVVRRIK